MILSQKQIEEIAAAVTEDFNKFFFGTESEEVRMARATPIDQFARDYLGLQVSFARLSSDGSICGLTAYQEAASRKRLPQFGHPLGDEYELSDEIPDPGDVENESLLKVMVSEALSRFDERDRIIIRYYLTGELTARQIEGRYDIPRNTVSNRARMLKKILQKIFLDLGQN